MIPAPGGPDAGLCLDPFAQFLGMWCQGFPDFLGHDDLESVPRAPRGGILDVWQRPDLFGEIGGRAVPRSVIAGKHLRRRGHQRVSNDASSRVHHRLTVAAVVRYAYPESDGWDRSPT